MKRDNHGVLMRRIDQKMETTDYFWVSTQTFVQNFGSDPNNMVESWLNSRQIPCFLLTSYYLILKGGVGRE